MTHSQTFRPSWVELCIAFEQQQQKKLQIKKLEFFGKGKILEWNLNLKRQIFAQISLLFLRKG